MQKGEITVKLRTDPKANRLEINRINKQRAKRMEAKISILFIGNTRGRVAYSGAGLEKGDNKIPLPNNSGNMMVECKTSARIDDRFGPTLPIYYDWFDKIENDRKAMGSRLGTLAIHWHNTNGYYIMFRREDISILESISGNTGYWFDGPMLDGTHNKAGKTVKSYQLRRNDVIKGMGVSKGTTANVRFMTHIGEYICVSIENFKTLAGFNEE